jgi:hypothetical protein
LYPGGNPQVVGRHKTAKEAGELRLVTPLAISAVRFRVVSLPTTLREKLRKFVERFPMVHNLEPQMTLAEREDHLVGRDHQIRAIGSG